MTQLDLDSPLADFYERLSHVRQIVCATEEQSKLKLLTSSRQRADLDIVGPATSNTANAMALVFLASSFEEFYREEIIQCAQHFSACYVRIPNDVKLVARNNYWALCVGQTKYIRTVLGTGKPRQIDIGAVSRARALIDAARGYALMDDVAALDGRIFATHQNNFRPHVVNEIGARLGINNLLRDVAEAQKIKTYFGESTKDACATKLEAKLNAFYTTRNEIVHSLNAATGQAVEVVFDYIDLFEITAESMRNVFLKHTSSW